MLASDLVPTGLFLLGILVSFAADLRLRRSLSTSWRDGCIAAAGVGTVFVACAAALR